MHKKSKGCPIQPYEFVTDLLPKRLLKGGFTSENFTWIQKWFKMSAGASRQLYIIGFPMLHSGFNFRPHVRTSNIFELEDPKPQAGSGTGRLGLPVKCHGPFLARKSEKSIYLSKIILIVFLPIIILPRLRFSFPPPSLFKIRGLLVHFGARCVCWPTCFPTTTTTVLPPLHLVCPSSQYFVKTAPS